MRAALALCLSLSLTAPASAQVVLGPEFDTDADLQMCRTSIEGRGMFVIFDAQEETLYENYTLREIFFGASENITCPAFVSLRVATPLLTDTEREPFCLVYDSEGDTITGFAQGDRDAFLMCKEPSKPLCERVNDSKDAAMAIAGFGAGTAAAAAGTQAAATAAGVSAVAHSSGAVILTGSAGYIAGTLGTIGATALSILTAPATLAAATVTVVAVGGAVYVCSPDTAD
jgi:hypothetical protein